MTEPLKKDRAHFPKGEQQKWILGVRKQASIQEIATLCSCSERTIRDWQRERFHMDYSCLKILCKTYSLSFPAVKKVAAFAHTSSAGKLGGKALIDRYGKVPVNEAFRKQCWQEWWVTEGVWKQNAILQPKKITTPHKSEKLAEFIGIMLGDGTVAPYHIAVTLHAVDDVEYSQYVSELISFLFHVQPKVYYRKDAQALNIVVARKELTEFLHVLGLPKGNKIKQGVSIPAWILHNLSLIHI